MILKKLIASTAVAAITLSMVISSTPFAFAGTFSDVPESSGFFSFVEDLADAGVISGQNGMFHPSNFATRGELSKMVVNASGASIDTSEGPSFSDVFSGNVFYQYIETAKSNSWINGYSDGTFRPSANVTRAEAAKIIAGAFEVALRNPTSNSYNDVNKSNVFYRYIEGLLDGNVISGNSNFRPNDLITRQEIAKLISNGMSYEVTDVPASNNSLTVSMNADSPLATTVPVSASNIIYLSLDLMAGPDEDVEIDQLKVSLGGLGSRSDFSAVKLFDGVRQVGNDKTFSSEDEVATFNMMAVPIVVPAGTTKRIDVRADLSSATTGNEDYFAIVRAEISSARTIAK